MEKTESAVHEEPTMCTKKEKIGHAIGVLGHDSAYTLWAMWMTPFLTDIVQLPAAILGGLLAFGRVFDGVNDIMMGYGGFGIFSGLRKYIRDIFQKVRLNRRFHPLVIHFRPPCAVCETSFCSFG